MITKRLVLVQLVLLMGFGAIFALPHARISSPAGIAMKLPIWVGPWIGEDAEISPKEVGGLARDTQFARKIYTSPDGDRIFVSIVLSGDDMASSIHRPERCLPAQGWSLQTSQRQIIQAAQGKSLPVTLLRSVRLVGNDTDSKFLITNLNYYWFVGYQRMTASHLERTLLDMRDRLLYGYDQRWAYVTVAAIVTKGWSKPNRSEPDTAAMVAAFTKDLVQKLEAPTGVPLM